MSKNAYITSNHLTGIANAIKEYVNIENEKLVGFIPITYKELVNLRNTSSLRPGFSYRITDYITTTTQTDTISANHQFDIIVTADSENALNEVARAAQHEGDTYFANSDLNAWEIWYCLDNDTERFAWPNESEEDEVLSESKIISTINSSSFSNTTITNAGQTITFDKPISHIIFNGTTYTLSQMQGSSGVQLSQAPPIYVRANSSTSLLVYSSGTVGTAFFNTSPIEVYTEEQTTKYAGKGVIYRMIDEWGNDCPYDFKNIKFKHDGLGTDVYTFTWIDENYEVMDTSMFGNNGKLTYYGEIYGVYGNVIKPYMETTYDENSGDYFGTKQSLNNITFISDYEYEGAGNDGFYGCYSNSFGNNCNTNSFGNNCSTNTFGYNCNSNNFGNNCKNNSFGNNCDSNKFDYNCHTNTFGNNCNSNSFRLSASNTGTLLNYCCYNHFDDGCSYIVIWNSTQPTHYNKLQNIKVDKSASGTSVNYYNIATLNSTTTIFISKEYNATSVYTNIPIGLYYPSTAVNNKLYTTNVTVTPSKSCINAAGGFYETSDERLKNFSDDVMIDLEKLSSLRKKYFTWKDGHGDQQLGVSAQEVQVLYPELVNEGDDGNLSVDYAKLSVVALSAVDKLYNKQKDLEDKLAKIEKALNL